MKIIFTPEVFLQLSLVETVVGKREFSGYGYVNVKKVKGETLFEVYDIVLLDVGTSGWTEFDSRKILDLLNREDAHKMKLWFHRHPVGNGVPGAHNWSGTDQNTCTNEPLGSVNPDQVKWALAAVLTPGGWVGRVDRFKNGKCTTKHLEVGYAFTPQMSALKETAENLLAEQVAREKTVTTSITVPADFDNDFYGYPIGYDEGSLDFAQANIDEAFNLLDVAECQMQDGYINEAADALNWALGIAETYTDEPLLLSRTRKLNRQISRLTRRLRRSAPHVH